jgi:hypothetical protein
MALNDASTQAFILLVDNNRLSRRDGTLRVIKFNFQMIVGE